MSVKCSVMVQCTSAQTNTHVMLSVKLDGSVSGKWPSVRALVRKLGDNASIDSEYTASDCVYHDQKRSLVELFAEHSASIDARRQVTLGSRV